MIITINRIISINKLYLIIFILILFTYIHKLVELCNKLFSNSMLYIKNSTNLFLEYIIDNLFNKIKIDCQLSLLLYIVFLILIICLLISICLFSILLFKILRKIIKSCLIN